MVYDPERRVYIGELERRGEVVQFGIKEKDRARHIYVIGQTGTGKSTLLEIMAVQDMRNKEGLIFIDPHGQSVEHLLEYVEEEHLDNIIYLAPHLQDRPIGLNIMEDVGYDHRHLVVSSLMASFEKLWGAASWSDRMAYILQNTLLALIEYPGTTLLDVGRMYANKDFRNRVVDNVKDPQVKKYWLDEFANYTDRYMQEATPAIQNKLGQFTANPLMRNIVGQQKSAFSFRQVMDGGKVLLINLSKGLIGEGNARMLGVLFTTKIYLDALSRSNMTRQELAEAAPCNFYVDEFQSFANSSFAGILSEARKYKLNLILAHQYIGQLYSDDAGDGNAIRDAVFGNVGTFISFRVGPVDAEIIAKQFTPYISEEDLVALPRRHMYLTLNIDGAGSSPFSARTFNMPEPPPVSLEEKVIEQSLEQYGIERSTVENIVRKNLEEDWGIAKTEKNTSRGGFGTNKSKRSTTAGKVQKPIVQNMHQTLKKSQKTGESLKNIVQKMFQKNENKEPQQQRTDNEQNVEGNKKNGIVSPLRKVTIRKDSSEEKVKVGNSEIDTAEANKKKSGEQKNKQDNIEKEEKSNDIHQRQGKQGKKKKKKREKRNTAQDRKKRQKPYASLGESIKAMQSVGIQKEYTPSKKKQNIKPPIEKEEGWASLSDLSGALESNNEKIE